MRRRAAAAAIAALLAGCATPPRRAVVPGSPTPPPPAGAPVQPPPPQIVPLDLFRLSGSPEQGALLSGSVPEGTALLMLDGKPVRFAADGRFIIGFGRDAPAGAVIEARTQDGRLLRAPMLVARHAWDVSSLPTLRRGSTPSPEYARIRAAESAQIEAARTRAVDSDGWRKPFRWPAIGRISTLFGSQRLYAGEPGAPHGGLDIARAVGATAPLEGTPAYAPADGVVVLATDHPFSLEGNMVMIGHGMGLVSVLMHLSRVDVATGDRITQGEPVGLIGKTGRATGPHLHWGMTWTDVRIDPLSLVGAMPAP